MYLPPPDFPPPQDVQLQHVLQKNRLLKSMQGNLSVGSSMLDNRHLTERVSSAILSRMGVPAQQPHEFDEAHEAQVVACLPPPLAEHESHPGSPQLYDDPPLPIVCPSNSKALAVLTRPNTKVQPTASEANWIRYRVVMEKVPLLGGEGGWNLLNASDALAVPHTASKSHLEMIRLLASAAAACSDSRGARTSQNSQAASPHVTNLRPDRIRAAICTVAVLRKPPWMRVATVVRALPATPVSRCHPLVSLQTPAPDSGGPPHRNFGVEVHVNRAHLAGDPVSGSRGCNSHFADQLYIGSTQFSLLLLVLLLLVEC